MKQHYSHQAVRSANIRHYDEIASDYFNHADYLYTAEDLDVIKGCMRGLSERAGDSTRFLDVGCGCGTLMKLAKGQFKEVYGVDISMEMLKHACEVSPRVARADLLQLPYRNHTFDMVAGHSVLHHLYDYNSVLAELARITKPGGAIYFDAEPNHGFSLLLRPLILLRRLFLRIRRRFERVYNISDESLAEYHHNYACGISVKRLIEHLGCIGFADINVEYRFVTKPRYQNYIFRALRFLTRLNCWAPLFRVTAIKAGE